MSVINLDQKTFTSVSDSDNDLPSRFSNEFYVVTIWIFLVCGFLSIVGDIFVLAANHFMTDVPRFIRRIVCLIVFCEMLNTLFLMWGMEIVLAGQYYSKVQFVVPFENLTINNGMGENSSIVYECKVSDPAIIENQACIIQAFVSNIMSMGIYIHVAYLSMLILVSNRIHKFNEVVVNTCLIIPWLIILPLVGVASMDDIYGYSPCTFVCWCVMKEDKETWMYVDDTAWELGLQLVVYCCYFFIFLIKGRIKKEKEDSIESSMYVDPDLNLRARKILQSTDRKIFFFPLIFTLCYLPGAVDYVIRLEKKNDPENIRNTASNRFLHVFHGIATNSTGIVNFLVFVAFHERARRYLKIAGRIFWNKWFRRGRQAKFSTEDYPGSIGQEFIPKMNNDYSRVDFLDS